MCSTRTFTNVLRWNTKTIGLLCPIGDHTTSFFYMKHSIKHDTSGVTTFTGTHIKLMNLKFKNQEYLITTGIRTYWQLGEFLSPPLSEPNQ